MNQSPTLLDSSLQSLREQIDADLAGRLDALDPAACPADLNAAMRHSLLAGGKRLRPTLVLLACEACDGDPTLAMDPACAIEMVHTYSLIHDDLPSMDDDDVRRGRPTCHVQFGESTAILAGDALLTMAFETIATSELPAEAIAGCVADLALAAGACGMVGGQVDDVAAEQGLDAATPAAEQLESIHRRKTGCLITAALTMGARVAGANQELTDALRNYGMCVGLAFQIADDLLDLTSTPQKMGKGTGKDAERGKLTYPALIGAATSRQRAYDLVQDACRWIEPLGERGERLERLARYIVERDR